MCMGCASMIWGVEREVSLQTTGYRGYISTASFSIFWLNGTHFGVHRTAVMFFCSHFTEPPHNSLFMYDNCKRTHHRWPLSTAHSLTRNFFCSQFKQHPNSDGIVPNFRCFRRARNGIESAVRCSEPNLCGPGIEENVHLDGLWDRFGGVFATQRTIQSHRTHSARWAPLCSELNADQNTRWSSWTVIFTSDDSGGIAVFHTLSYHTIRDCSHK